MIEAYETPEPNDWVRPVALGVTVLLIAWNMTGWFLDKGWTFEAFFIAAMTAAFSLLSFNASAQMRRAAAKAKSPGIAKARRFWTGVLFMCSAWSAYSAHHAFGAIVATDIEWTWSADAIVSIVANAPALVVLTVAAFIEPFLPWAIETVEAAPKASQTPPEPSQPTEKPDSSSSQIGSRRASQGASRTVARVLRNSRPKLHERADSANVRRVRERAPPLTESQIREAVAALTAENKVVNLANVARFHDVPYSRVDRSPGKHLLRHAA